MNIVEQNDCVKVETLGIGDVFKYDGELFMIILKGSVKPKGYVDTIFLLTGELTTFPITSDVVEVEANLTYKVKDKNGNY